MASRESLMLDVQHGNAAAFEELVTRHERQVSDQIALLRTEATCAKGGFAVPDPDLVEDLTQSVFM